MAAYTGFMAAQRSIAASEFKAKCLALLDEVAETKETLVVTKRGKPIARVIPAEPRTLIGSAVQLVSDKELVNFSAWEGFEDDNRDV
jgi:prevent-host-death family protein